MAWEAAGSKGIAMLAADESRVRKQRLASDEEEVEGSGRSDDRGLGNCDCDPFFARASSWVAATIYDGVEEEDSRDGSGKGAATRLGAGGEEGNNVHMTREETLATPKDHERLAAATGDGH
ncbi:hypothetical protein B296_00020467 [Ensete ventricosum]|uniref:Uncharacterized protein n=1 Tax=Ensete ventricosum TaxID=4639 RepID=A0A427A4Y0_ENSVE|nr:hypothetical protein B296_00020467 [Ensete ventricosum]